MLATRYSTGLEVGGSAATTSPGKEKIDEKATANRNELRDVWSSVDTVPRFTNLFLLLCYAFLQEWVGAKGKVLDQSDQIGTE